MRALIAGLVALLLAGCTSFGDRREPADILLKRQTLVLEALGQIGRPYRFGGASPSGFDCSGLVHYVYAQAGLNVPRTTREQFAAGARIRADEAQPGDLLFYRFRGRAIDHVALYLGDGQALHAPATGRTVIVAGVAEPYWQQRLAGAARLLPR